MTVDTATAAHTAHAAHTAESVGENLPLPAASTASVSPASARRPNPGAAPPHALAPSLPTEGTSSPQSSARLPVAALPPAQAASVQAAVASLNALLDGFGSMLLAQQQIRSESVTRGQESAEAGEASAEAALQQQQEAMEAAIRAAARAERLMSRAPRWVKKLIAAVITIAGAVAGAFTGGAAAGLAIAGAVLILAGDAISKMLVALGVDEEKAMWAGFAVKVAGTVLSLGAGAAGGAASTVNTAQEVIQTAAQILDQVTSTVQASVQGARAGFEFQAENHRLDAAEAATDADVARDAQAEAVELLREAEASYTRLLGRMQAWLQTQHDTTAALTARLDG